jgi:hypothetical protein
MANGFSMPLRANASGGMAMATGEENNNKIIRIALADGDNDNAYQQNVTLDQALIFNLTDPAMRARAEGRIETIFAKFEADNRFKLLADTMEWSENSGEMKLNFRYLDLESDQEATFSQGFRS